MASNVKRDSASEHTGLLESMEEAARRVESWPPDVQRATSTARMVEPYRPSPKEVPSPAPIPSRDLTSEAFEQATEWAEKVKQPQDKKGYWTAAIMGYVSGYLAANEGSNEENSMANLLSQAAAMLEEYAQCGELDMGEASNLREDILELLGGHDGG